MPSLTPAAPLRAHPMRRWFRLALLLLVAFVLLWWLWISRFGQPEDFDHMESQFKYGSIGADHPLAQVPAPYWLWKVLPKVVTPEAALPPGEEVHLRTGYEVFGLVTEAKPDAPRDLDDVSKFLERPIGHSRRRVFGMDFVGLNCAFCHLGAVQDKPGAHRQVVLGGVGNTVNIEGYFLYLFSAIKSPEFTSAKVMPEIEAELKRQGATMPWWQRAAYKYLIIPIAPHYFRWMESELFDFIDPNSAKRLPPFGPGRVNTWGLYKRVFVEPPQRDTIAGTADFPSLWNQKARQGMRMHWDGNTDVLLERNIVSALSLIGSRVEYLDFERLTRVTEWIEGLLPPRYVDRLPDEKRLAGQPLLNEDMLKRGQQVFNAECSACHAATGDRIGRVEPIDDLGTDRSRIDEFTPELANALNKLGTDQWSLRHFRVENGYVNTPLDGAWLRAPYLHNGSVPTLNDLLKEPKDRPSRFCRGGAVYDWENLGYVSALSPDAANPCPGLFLYETRPLTPGCTKPTRENGQCRSGNSNEGHLYGTKLPEADKRALLELMKTF